MNPDRENEIFWWTLKLTALLHDIPWKPWLITGLYRVRITSKLKKEYDKIVKNVKEKIEDTLGRLEVHEEESLVLIITLLKELGVSDDFIMKRFHAIWSKVSEADSIAASLDRIISPRIAPHMLTDIRFVNPFNPNITWPLTLRASMPDEKQIEDFINEMRNIISKLPGKEDVVNNLKKAYFILYSLLEKLWYESAGLKSLPMADTRVPHHTVFTHAHATASALNMVYADKWLIMSIDIPGIQRFVSKGRKTRDYWASSWLLSFIIWSAIKLLIEHFGPDVVLTPSIHYNSFYIDLLIGMGLDEKYTPKISWSPWRWPSQPIMPAMATLILPLSSREDYVNKAWRKLIELGKDLGCKYLTEDATQAIRCIIKELMKSIWNKLKEELIKKFNELSKESDLLQELIKELCDYTHGENECIRETKRYLNNLLNTLPFNVRLNVAVISWEDVKREYKRLELRMKERKLLEPIVRFMKESLDLRESRNLYKYLRGAVAYLYSIKKLREVIENSSNMTFLISPQVIKYVSEYTSSIYYRKVASRYAICSMCGELPAAIYLRRGAIDKLERYGYIIDEGEALCPYCFIRRLLAKFPEATSQVLSSVNKLRSLGERIRGYVHSTLDVANVWNNDLFKYLMKILPPESKMEPVLTPYKLLKNLVKDYKEYVEQYLLADQVITHKGLDIIKRVKPEIEKYTFKYIAYVYGDGDNVSKIYEGIIPAKFLSLKKSSKIYLPENLTEYSMKYGAYLLKVLESSSAISKLSKDVIKLWIDAYSALIQGFIDSKLLKEEAKLIPTLSYVRILSHSMTISSCIDAKIIEAVGGVLIYAGGDDIVTILPVSYNRFDKVKINLPLKAITGIFKDIIPRPIEVLYRELSKILLTSNAYAVLPLMIIHLTRLNYWGMIPTAELAQGVKPIGFHVYNEVVTPAIISYGRSYGLALVHYRTPLWVGYTLSRTLENAKNYISTYYYDTEKGKERIIPVKDLTIISYNEGEGKILPNTLNGKLIPENICKVHTFISLLIDCVYTGNCSHSIIYESSEESTLNLIKKLVSRRKLDHTKISLIKLLYRSIIDKYLVDLNLRNEIMKELSSLSEWFVKTNEETLPAITQLFICVRDVYSALR